MLVLDILKEKAIHYCASERDQKAAMVERLNRKLKTGMWKYFKAKKRYREIDLLGDVLEGHNHARHRQIGMAPANVRPENEEILWRRIYPNYAARSGDFCPIQKVQSGDPVRLSKAKHTFEKGYVPNWTEEIVKVSGYSRGRKTKVYKVRDWAGDEIHGVF